MLSATAVLSGCAGSLARSAYDSFATPEADTCKGLKGKSLADAEKQLNMGKADAVSEEDGTEIRTYSKGAMNAEITVVNDHVSKAKCTPIKR